MGEGKYNLRLLLYITSNIHQWFIYSHLHFVIVFKSHNNVVGLYKKPFPFFNELQQIYGKDRANGEEAKDPYDAIQIMEKEMQQNQEG